MSARRHSLSSYCSCSAPLRFSRTTLSSLLQADKSFVQALLQKDAASAANFLSADFTWIDSAGKRYAREKVLEYFPAVGNADVDAQVSVYGNTAVVRANRGKVNVLRVW